MKIIAVTDRKSAGPTFLSRIEAIAGSGVDAIMLREKDMEEGDCAILAELVDMSCGFHDVEFIVNSFIDIAGIRRSKLQLPMDLLRENHGSLMGFEYGASIHSVEDLREAENMGASWVIFGNVFETGCKPGKEGAGIDALREICEISSIPVYAIGGIKPNNARSCMEAGAAGICVMSAYMQCESPDDLTAKFRLALQ